MAIAGFAQALSCGSRPSVGIDEVEISEPVSFTNEDVQGCDLKTMVKQRTPILFEFKRRFQSELTSVQDCFLFLQRPFRVALRAFPMG